MPTNTIQRCPFLRGSNCSQQFEYTNKSAGTNLRLDFKCSLRGIMFHSYSNAPTQYGCLDGKYTFCECYARQLFELSVTVPITCPLWNEETQKCNKKSCKCEIYWIDPIDNSIDDYRKCEAFSEWFWEKKCNSKEDAKE